MNNAISRIDLSMHSFPIVEHGDLPTLDNSQDYDSFYNSFFESYWKKYTLLNSIDLKLKLKGKGSVVISRNFSNGTTEHVCTKPFDLGEFAEINISVPFSKSELDSRLSYQIKSEGNAQIEKEGSWETRSLKKREVCLGIVFCTFNREDYLKKNLELLKKSSIFNNLNVHLFVIDNASNLNLQNSERITYIPQDNLGGAGGFSRGLSETLKVKEITHTVFMDDDVKICPEVFERIQRWHEYSIEDSPICGAMVNLEKPNETCEQGALFVDKSTLFITSINDKLDLNEKPHLDKLTQLKEVDYGGWWLFSFPKKVVQKSSFPLPFFIKGDDIEYGVRLKRDGFKTIPVPGIWLWHEPFESKSSAWVTFYDFKNRINSLIIHKPSSIWFQTTLDLILSFGAKISSYSYDHAYALILAMEKVLLGPSSLREESTPEGNSKIIKALGKFSKTEVIAQKNQEQKEKGINLLSFLINILTLRGHLIPSFLLKEKEEVHGKIRVSNTFSAFPSKKMKVYREYRTEVSSLNHKQFFKLLLLFGFTFIRLLLNLPRLKHEWEENFNYLTSEQSWKENFWKIQ